jgi:hypothetical protein
MSEMHASAEAPDNKPANGSDNTQHDLQVNGQAQGVGDAPVSRQVHRQTLRDNEKHKDRAR